MTTAKIVTTPAQGHGLTQKITDQHFAMAVRGEPVPLLPAVVMFKQVGFDEKETAQGKHRSVRYEIAKLEPIIDASDASELQFMVEALYKSRTSPDGQAQLPMSFPGQQEEEKRKAAMEAMEDWAEREGLTGAELEQRWRDHFGVGDPDGNLYGIPGDYRKSPLAYLSQFAFAVGALGAEPEQTQTGELGDGDGDGDGDEAAGGDDTGADGE